MDRQYKAYDHVTVHENDKAGPIIDRFKQKAYSWAGYDNYRYNDRMYKGFVRPDGSVYILLSHPLLP